MFSIIERKNIAVGQPTLGGWGHVHQHEKSVYKKNCLVQFISKADICAKQLKMINIAQIKWYFSIFVLFIITIEANLLTLIKS